MKKNSYTLIFLIVLFSGLSLTGAVNLIVDPAGVFGIVEREGFNAMKTELMRGGGRRDKAAALKAGGFHTVILGSSRAEVGIDPRNPAFGASRVYNASLPATNMVETHRVFEFIKEKTAVKRVIIGLDFLLFSASGGTGGDFRESLFAGDSELKTIANLFSLDELSRSFDTLRDNLGAKEARYSKLGFRYKLNSVEKLGGHREAFDDILENTFFKATGPYAAYKYSPERLSLLGAIIEECESAGIELILFISPVHARQAEAIGACGLDRDYERWKRDLAAFVTDVAERPGLSARARVALWDFGGYNAMTTEPLPKAGDSTTKMRWYWESSHYKSALGAVVLARILGLAPAEPGVKGFGVKISSANIEAHLSDERAARRAYRLKHPEERAAVEALRRRSLTKRAPSTP